MLMFLKVAAILMTMSCTALVYYTHAVAGNSGGHTGSHTGSGVHGAPGPIVGIAGGPLLAAYGLYALWRRRNRVG
jgi:hypothetical protein